MLPLNVVSSVYLMLPNGFDCVVSTISERMRTISPEEWAAILAKAKQKKAQEEGADPTAALIVKDTPSSQGVKRRRKTTTTRPAKVQKAGPATTTSPIKQDKGVDMTQGETCVEVHHIDPPSPPPVTEAAGETVHGGGVKEPSPFGDTFDPEEYIRTHFVLEGNLDRFEAMDASEIRRVALGFEFKGMMLNYFVSARREKEADAARKKFEEKLVEARESMERSHAISVQELIDSHHEALEKVKANCESRLEALKKVYVENRVALEDKLRASEINGRNLVKSRNGLIVSLPVAEDDAAGFEEEVVELEESNSALKDSLGEKYAEGFAATLAQVKVLFPDLDEAILYEVDLLKFVEDGKLVSRLPPPEGVPNEAAADYQPESESR
jgi:hypothetical protein